MSVREVRVKEIKRLHTLAKLTRLEKQRLVLIELLYKALESIDQPLESPCAICKSISCRARLAGLEKCPLGGEEFADARFGVVHHFQHLCARKGLAFGSGLDFDKAAIFGHDDVHVDFGLRVFFVSQIEEDFIVDDADAGGGDKLAQRRLLERARFDQAIQREGERGAGAGDGRGASAAVGLQYVTVEDHCAFAEGLHVDHGTQRAADKPLDLMSAAGDLAALGLARSPGEGGSGKHAVFGCDPSAAAVA